MTVLKIIGVIAAVALLALSGFLAQTPWRVHGGRFITEYMLLAGLVALIGLAILAASLLLGTWRV
jgi:hypothetical protein